MSVEDSGSDSEHFDEAASDDGEEAEYLAAEGGNEVDPDDATDSEEDDETSTDEEDIDEDASSHEGHEEGEDDDSQEILEEALNFPPAEANRIDLGPRHHQGIDSGIATSSVQSPAESRRLEFFPAVRYPRSYVVDAICALPHPVPTNALASSMCMTHLITGSDDGYIRDYDIFTACNGKNFLTAPQRQHCGFVEGVIKAGVLRSWWESTSPLASGGKGKEAVYSLLAQSDALWGLSGLEGGSVNLFTLRHETGRVVHSFSGHKGPVASMAFSPDEKAFFSAGWDGEIKQWDLNTGALSQKLPSQGAQLSVVALRPYYNPLSGPLVSFGQSTAPHTSVPVAIAPLQEENTLNDGPTESNESGKITDKSTLREEGQSESQKDSNDEARSDTSYDPLFDAEPENEFDSHINGSGEDEFNANTKIDIIGPGVPFAQGTRLFDQSLATRFSFDVLLTASIDGQLLLWDRRASFKHVGRLGLVDKCPPWCVSACWSADGAHIYAGRRNGTVDIWDVRQLGTKSGGAPRILRILRNPLSSGEVSCVTAFPDGKHLACASHDNIRLWNVYEQEDAKSKGAQFKIVTGHHGGQISQILMDPAGRFMISASGNRGWFGESTRTVLVHDIKNVT